MERYPLRAPRNALAALGAAVAVVAMLAVSAASARPHETSQLRVREYAVPSGTHPHDVGLPGTEASGTRLRAPESSAG